jgi:hypothetical protein
MYHHVPLVGFFLNSSLLRLLHPHVVLEWGFVLDFILMLLELKVRPVSAPMFLMVMMRLLLLMLSQSSEV